jgi:hypothetical protein
MRRAHFNAFSGGCDDDDDGSLMATDEEREKERPLSVCISVRDLYNTQNNSLDAIMTNSINDVKNINAIDSQRKKSQE